MLLLHWHQTVLESNHDRRIHQCTLHISQPKQVQLQLTLEKGGGGIVCPPIHGFRKIPMRRFGLVILKNFLVLFKFISSP